MSNDSDEPRINEIPNPNIPEKCSDQDQRTRQVAGEAHRLANRLERDGVAILFQIQVYGFDCDNKAHASNKDGNRVQSHVDYIAGGGRLDVPGATQTVIKALEHSLAELKKKLQ